MFASRLNLHAMVPIVQACVSGSLSGLLQCIWSTISSKNILGEEISYTRRIMESTAHFDTSIFLQYIQ